MIKSTLRLPNPSVRVPVANPCHRIYRETITAAPIPPAIIDGGMAAVGLLTWVMVSKYLDHLPLYRLEQIAARDKVILARSTLAEWVGRTGVALQPVADRLIEILLERGKVIYWSMTMAATKPCSRLPARKRYLALSLGAGHMHAGNFSICTKPMPVPWRWKR